MEIEVKSQTDDEIVFIVRDAEVPFINAIRRCAMVNVPKIAIEDVNIMRNDSAMFNEVLAHRLGLTPLVSNMDAIEGLPLPGDDDYEENNSVMFSLKEEGPKVVYSKDLISSDSKIKPVYDTIPLVKLKEGEKLNIEAVAKNMLNGCQLLYVFINNILKSLLMRMWELIMNVLMHAQEVF